MSPTEKPILFHYPPSIYSHRVLWYLWLRGIPYDECIQPPVKPRPDLEALDINYRRIPIMAIGQDIYSDSRLIISKLESLYPGSSLSPKNAFDAGIRALFENWCIDGGIFANTVKLMPYWTASGLLSNKTFVDDRQKLGRGPRMTAQLMEENRPDGLQHIRQAFEMLETTFLADGRKWILGNDEPSLADIDAVWPFEWMISDKNMEECLPKDLFNDQRFPKTFDWVKRFIEYVNKNKDETTKPTAHNGTEVHDRIMNASGEPEKLIFIQDDPLKLGKGDEVEVFASDYGFTHKDRGPIIGLTKHEVVIRNSKGLHLHFPRWNFRINKVKPSQALVAPMSPSKEIPKMRLIYHHASPFTRKAFMHAHELGLASQITLDKVVVCPVPFPGWSDNNDEVAAFNPMAKIPCLVSDDVQDGIYDSRNICDYLSHLSSVKVPSRDQQYWKLHSLHACADGMMDAAVLIAYETRIREPRGLKFDEWVQGQKTKIVRGLDRFESATQEGLLVEPPQTGPASADEIAVAVATAMTEHMGFLGVNWRDGREKLAQWLQVWRKRRSFMETPADQDWQTQSISKI